MYRLLSIMIIFTVALSCTQPDNKDKNTKETPETKEISEKSQGLDKTVVAKVNDAPIYKYTLDNNLNNPLKEAIVREVLIQKAIKDGLVEEIDYKNIDLNNRVESTKIASFIFSTDQLMRRKILSNVNVNKKITDEELNKYYNDNIEKYTYVKTLVYSVDSDEATAGQIRKMLLSGSTVDNIRDEYSDQNIKISVEEKKLTNDPLILTSFDVIKVGAISKPIRFTGNYNLYKIVEVKKVSIDKISSALKQNIKSSRKQEAINGYVDNLIKTKEFNVIVLEGDNNNG